MISSTSDWYQHMFSLVIDIISCTTSDFSIYVMQLTLKVKTPKTVILVNNTSRVGRQ